MTNYGAWEAKAGALVREAEEEEEREAKASDAALGLEGGPIGPPRAEAERQLRGLEAKSGERKGFLQWQAEREVTLTHGPQDGEVTLSGAEVDGKGVRLSGSEGVTYVVPEGTSILKLMLDKCREVVVRLEGAVVTRCVEVDKCSDLEIVASAELATLQADNCPGDIRVRFADRELAGTAYHQNCPGLHLGLGTGADAPLEEIGSSAPVQFCTRLSSSIRAPFFESSAVSRRNGEWPEFPGAGGAAQPEPEAAPEAEERRVKAEEARARGNEAFRASDFMQAAAEYSAALNNDPASGVVLANRAQCWLKLGHLDKALADAVKCTEVDPANTKGWFRKGMALHAAERYEEAIPALLAAEERDPTNKQVADAIRMAQLKARQAAASRS